MTLLHQAAQKAVEVAGIFRMFTKSSHRFHDGRPLHLVAAELLEMLAAPHQQPDPETRPRMSMFANAADYNAAMDEWLAPPALQQPETLGWGAKCTPTYEPPALQHQEVPREPVAPSDGREQFEAWLRARWPNAIRAVDEKTPAGFYMFNENNFYWEAWQASRAAASPSTTRQQEVGREPTSEQMMAGYAVACNFKVYEAQAFKLAEEMYRAMLAAAPSTPENAGGVGAVVSQTPPPLGTDGGTTQ